MRRICRGRGQARRVIGVKRREETPRIGHHGGGIEPEYLPARCAHVQKGAASFEVVFVLVYDTRNVGLQPEVALLLCPQPLFKGVTAVGQLLEAVQDAIQGAGERGE